MASVDSDGETGAEGDEVEEGKRYGEDIAEKLRYIGGM